MIEGVTPFPVTRCRVRPWREVRLLGAGGEKELFKFETACLFFPHAGPTGPKGPTCPMMYQALPPFPSAPLLSLSIAQAFWPGLLVFLTSNL